jgi:uncharacterized membrane-anchored protein YitT (DUF2179 family)
VKPSPTCDESKIVGEGLASLQTAIATLFAPFELATELVTGFLYSGFAGLVGVTPLQVIEAANTVFDIVNDAQLSKNKTLVSFVTPFANNIVVLAVAVYTVISPIPPSKDPAGFTALLKTIKEIASDILEVVYALFPARRCPTSTRQLKKVLDAGLLLLMLTNFVAFLIGLFVAILIISLGARKGTDAATIELDPRLLAYLKNAKYDTDISFPTSFKNIDAFFTTFEAPVHAAFPVLASAKRLRNSK